MAANDDFSHFESPTFQSPFDESYEAITMADNPKTEKWKLPLVYRITLNGMNVWQIAFDGEFLKRVYGSINSVQYSDLKVEMNTRSKSLNSQALIQGRGLFTDKYYEGYQEDIMAVPEVAKAMKGYYYSDPKQIKHWPVLASLKLDGVRILAREISLDEIDLESNGNRKYNHLSVIRAQLIKLMPYIPRRYSVLDGETYRHGFDLERIKSAVRTTESIHPEIHLIEYHIFDIKCKEKLSSNERLDMLKKAYTNCVNDGNEIPNIKLCDHWFIQNLPELDFYKNQAWQANYEGLVLRHSSINLEKPPTYLIGTKAKGKGSKTSNLTIWNLSLYVEGRTVGVIKVKKFISEEGIVVGVEKCTGKEAGLGKLILLDRYHLKVPIRYGEEATRKRWLSNPESVIGKLFTFEHAGRHEKTMKPRQPHGKGFRDQDYPSNMTIEQKWAIVYDSEIMGPDDLYVD